MIIEALPARSKEKTIINTTQNIEEIYKKYANMIYWVSFAYMKNNANTEDIVADVFVKLIKSKMQFQSEEHEKAWLLRTAINLCKDSLKHWRRKLVDIDEYENLQGENPFETNEILKSVMELPGRYKDAVYLYYYEGYSTEEIARILKKPQSTVRVHLHEARKILKGVLENEE
ncbi:MAG: RNA polymerase sigma factor [Oscillospiraceae bacterium]|nr:RNA polymerase sigma factor [Oscillospiraceae bacterium]